MNVPTSIAAWEELGRGVYSKSQAGRCRRSNVPAKVFLERVGEIDISVDRLTFAPRDEAFTIAKERDSQRDEEFQGWAVITAMAAASEGRTVAACPIDGENLYHANIVLPSKTATCRELQKQHALELANSSIWREGLSQGWYKS